MELHTANVLARMIKDGEDPSVIRSYATVLDQAQVQWREKAVFTLFHEMEDDPSFVAEPVIDAILPLMHPEKPAHDREWYWRLSKSLSQERGDSVPFFPLLLTDTVELSDAYLETPNGKAGMEFVASMLAQGIRIPDGKHLKATLSHRQGCHAFADALLRNYSSGDVQIDLGIMQHMQQAMGGTCSPQLCRAISETTALRTQDFLPGNGSWERKMENTGWNDSAPWQVGHGWLDRNIVQQTLEGIRPEHRAPELEAKLLSALALAQNAAISQATSKTLTRRGPGLRL